MRRAFVMILAMLLPQCVLAAPLADRVPADAIVYVGWQGSRAAGPAYQASRLKQLVDVSDIGQMRGFIERLAVRLGRDDASVAEAAQMLTPVADVLWASPAALYVGPIAKNAAGEQPGDAPVRMVLIIDAGPAAADTAAKLQTVLSKQTGRNPMTVKTIGPLVAVGTGIDEGLTNLLGGRVAGQTALAGSADFRDAIKDVGNDAAVTVFISVDALRGELDRTAKSDWTAWRDALNVKGVRYLAHSAGFDGKEWRGQTFVAAPAPRQGIAAVFDQPAMSDEFLRVIPRNATLVMAGQFDLARLLKETRTVLGKADSQTAGKFDQAMSMAKSATGVDLETGLAASLGSEWALYAAPGIGGSRAMGWVVANRLRDPAGAEAALTSLENALCGLASSAMHGSGMQLSAIKVKQGKLSVHYFGVPMVSPAWTIQNGVLYMALYPQVAVSAAESALAGGPSILENPTIVEARKRLGKTPAGFEFMDLPATAGDGYGTALLLSRYALGFADMAGVQAPTMFIPPLHKLQPLLAPSISVSWSDDAGWHKRGTEPFPGSILLAGDVSMGMIMQPGILAAIVIPQFTNASEDARQSATRSTVQSIRAQTELYRLQHGDAYPDLAKYPRWEQLTQKTSEQGVPDAKGKFGPYLQAAPSNPLNGSSAVEVINGPVQAGDSATKPGIGWVFDKAKGRIYATGRDGMTISVTD